MTGVDKLHAEGNFGQGIKIGMCVPQLLFTLKNETYYCEQY